MKVRAAKYVPGLHVTYPGATYDKQMFYTMYEEEEEGKLVCSSQPTSLITCVVSAAAAAAM